MIIMSTHNIGFYEEISKIVPNLSSNTHLISSSVFLYFPENGGDEVHDLQCRYSSSPAAIGLQL